MSRDSMQKAYNAAKMRWLFKGSPEVKAAPTAPIAHREVRASLFCHPDWSHRPWSRADSRARSCGVISGAASEARARAGQFAGRW